MGGGLKICRNPDHSYRETEIEDPVRLVEWTNEPCTWLSVLTHRDRYHKLNVLNASRNLLKSVSSMYHPLFRMWLATDIYDSFQRCCIICWWRFVTKWRKTIRWYYCRETHHVRWPVMRPRSGIMSNRVWLACQKYDPSICTSGSGGSKKCSSSTRTSQAKSRRSVHLMCGDTIAQHVRTRELLPLVLFQPPQFKDTCWIKLTAIIIDTLFFF